MTALACLGVVAVDADDGLPSSPILPIDVLGLLVVGVLVLVFRRMRDVDHRTLCAVRSVSETAQKALLPRCPAVWQGWRSPRPTARQPPTHTSAVTCTPPNASNIRSAC
ncbi:hypothetical protein ACFQ51_01755 [Streptomyces kaempferi]